MNDKLKASKEILKKRHSEYALSPEWVTSEEEVEALLGEVLHLTPSHFNSQPVRMVLLKGEAHKAHWKLIEEILIDRIGKEAYDKNTRGKIEGAFLSGAGTVVFFDDTTITKNMINQFPAYAHNFPNWAQQVQGSHQLMVWLGLTSLGYGASLQHYNGIDDDKVKEQLGVPKEWDFIAHMPFGKVLNPAGEKEKKPLSETLIIKK